MISNVRPIHAGPSLVGSAPRVRNQRPRVQSQWLPILGAAILLSTAGMVHAQTDPGPRPRPSTGGNATRLPLADSVDMQKFWGGGQNVFKQVFSVSGNSSADNISGEPGVGLGPGFNGNSCAMCHSQPKVGGTSPGVNPEVALANLDDAANTIPSFIAGNGPVREARFIVNASNQLDGSVHNLFTIAGRSDAAGCNLAQPNFAQQLSNNNVIFRIPTPLFGLGLVENTPEGALQTNLTATQTARNALGIAGRFNTNGNDGTITRFGWKAQNKSLVLFAGEALSVELGVSNQLFTSERSAIGGCVFNNTPEDGMPATGPDPADTTGATTGTATQMASAMENLATFMRFNAPPAPAVLPFTYPNGNQITAASVGNGQNLFSSIGCALCHSPALTTAASQFEDLNNVTFQPYSDFALHHMGSNLADGVSQGGAGPDEFRTAPLWGVGQRLFFLHDGRASDLLAAIKAHSSPLKNCVTNTSVQTFRVAGDFFAPITPGLFCGSEANGVINNFSALSASNQQDILNFLRSL